MRMLYYMILYCASLSSLHSIIRSSSSSSSRQLVVSAFNNPHQRAHHYQTTSSVLQLKQQQARERQSVVLFTGNKMAAIDIDSSNDSINPLSRRGLPSPLILGSASFTRKLILSEMNIPYLKIIRPIDEKSIGDRTSDAPHDLVLTLAIAKMNHLVNEIQNGNCHEEQAKAECIILTGDQVVTHDGNILEKPIDIDEAKQFVNGYAKSPCSTVGSCVLTHLPSMVQVSGYDSATIHFKSSISGELVDMLLAEDAPILSCAGGLMIEHPLTKQHIERIDGTEDSVMGLSKDLVERLLDELKDKLDK